MLITDLHSIGNNLYKIRKMKGFTQAEVAEKSEISDRTYADIERGSVTMRIDSLLKICNALKITPNDILMSSETIKIKEEDIVSKIKDCTEKEKETLLKILNIYVNSLN